MRSAGWEGGEAGRWREDGDSKSDRVGAGEVLITEEESMEAAGAEVGERNLSEVGRAMTEGPGNTGGVNHCSASVFMCSLRSGYTFDGISEEGNASEFMAG